MASPSPNIEIQVRDKVGSRDARKLRAQGRIPASLQSEGEKPHYNLHLNEEQFLTSRRQHVHVYDLKLGDKVQSAVVRELQWDAMGSCINHVEFKRVDRNVETEAEIELSFAGLAKGVVNHLHTHITVRCLPGDIPDGIEVPVEALEPGAHILAKDLNLPTGVKLAVDPEMEVVIISAQREELEAPAEGEEGEADEGVVEEGGGEA